MSVMILADNPPTIPEMIGLESGLVILSVILFSRELLVCLELLVIVFILPSFTSCNSD